VFHKLSEVNQQMGTKGNQCMDSDSDPMDRSKHGRDDIDVITPHVHQAQVEIC